MKVAKSYFVSRVRYVIFLSEHGRTMLKELKRHLSKHDLVELMSLSYQSLTCDNLEEFKFLIIKLKELFHYEYAICVQADTRAIIRSDPKNLDLNVCNISYPTEYLDLYLYKYYFLKDAVLKKFISNLAPVNWPPYKKRDNSELCYDLMTAAADLKITRGWLHGTPTAAADRITAFGFSSPFIAYDQRVSKTLEYIVPFYAETYQRLQQQTAATTYNLTGREKEILNWIKEGKSSWEISMVLKCSKRTIDFHVENIKQKLNVVSRAQAVAAGLHYGVITF